MSSPAPSLLPHADAMVFPCAGCGRDLKIKPSLAGKTVKCRRCAHIMLAPAPTQPEPIWRVLLPPCILTLILWTTFGLQLHNLDHTAITRWDEVFHAVVAQNVMKHPLKPTLVDVPYLPYDQSVWGENHVWLHKPILPFWQTALFLAIFGVNTFALRLPAAILSTGAALFTYLIGTELFDRRTALIAVALQTLNPFLMTLIHGYQFADNVDIALLFWVEASIYFLVRTLRTASWSDLLLAGLAQGLAFLCKSYLAGIMFGIALAAWLLPICRLAHREDCRIGPLRLLAMLGVTVLTIAPWHLYCMIEFPEEFWHEQTQIIRHLDSNVERWGAPWDRVVFGYMMMMYGVFYTPILVASFLFLGKAITQKHAGLWLTYAWALGVVVPHLFAVTKTPSATMLALPAFMLLLGHLISEAWRGERWPLAALSAILLVSLIFPAVLRGPGHGYPASGAFAAVMRQSIWVVYHVVGALILAAIVVGVWTLARRLVQGGGLVGRCLHVAALLFCSCALAWLGYQYAGAAWAVTARDANEPHLLDVGQYARANLPENAVLLCDTRIGHEHLTTMFYADRTCYPIRLATQLDEMARDIVAAGGKPYIVSRRTLPFATVYVSGANGPSIYEWRPVSVRPP